MCIKWFINLFNTPEPPPVTLPHPHNASHTPDQDSGQMMEEFLTHWNVPETYKDFWRGIPVTVMDGYIYPASWQDADGNPLTYSDEKLTFDEAWDDEGVCAHECAHVSWEFLTPAQRDAFATLHDYYKNVDPYMKLLYSINTYGLTNSNEAHSEIFRYIGDKMPLELKKFYPRLIDV
jgi:hypothetical protein